MTTPELTIDALQRRIALENLKRLAPFEPPTKPPSKPGLRADNPCPVGLEILKEWSDDNKGSIQTAIDRQVFLAKQDIEWNTAFLPFMESTAVYLRDWGKRAAAWETYRKYERAVIKDPDVLNDAIKLSLSADGDIDDLAKHWGLRYMTLCDLITEHPDDHVDWDGPFCGAFFTTDAQSAKPFIGVAFKGTNPLNNQEAQVDINYQLQSGGKFLGGRQISTGVYTGLFGTFRPPKGNPSELGDDIGVVPYTLIHDSLNLLAFTLPGRAAGPIRTHVTGHSLGGSYSSLCYAQLLLDIPPLPTQNIQIVMGDEYTFGAPRIGSNDWANFNFNLVGSQPGRIWRIVHDNDIVPQVPPTNLKPDQLDFHHVDQGIQIFEDKSPECIPSERNTENPPPYDAGGSMDAFIQAVLDSKAHIPNFYYNAMVYAIKNPGKLDEH